MGQAKILQFPKAEDPRLNPKIEPGYKDRSKPKPKPWTRWYDAHYIDLFDGIGASIVFIVFFLMFVVIYANIARFYFW